MARPKIASKAAGSHFGARGCPVAQSRSARQCRGRGTRKNSRGNQIADFVASYRVETVWRRVCIDIFEVKPEVGIMGAYPRNDIHPFRPPRPSRLSGRASSCTQDVPHANVGNAHTTGGDLTGRRSRRATGRETDSRAPHCPADDFLILCPSFAEPPRISTGPR